jgi:hypothetical protein
MGRREQFSVGELIMVGIPSDVSATDQVLVLGRNASMDIILCAGTTVPTNGDAGFAVGCIFIKTNTGTLYLNGGAGTNLSCAFALLGVAVAPGAITALELAANAVTTAKILNANVTPAKMSLLTKVTENTDNDITVTAAQLLGGYMRKTGCTGPHNVAMDTAANIQAAFVATAGAWFEWEFMNSSGQTETITLGVGVTLYGTAAVPNGKSARVKFVNTGAGAIDAIISLSA